jgi:hypothetical protein
MNASTRWICCCCPVSRKTLEALCVIHTHTPVPSDQFSPSPAYTSMCEKYAGRISAPPPLQQMSYYIVVINMYLERAVQYKNPAHLLPLLYKLDSYHYVTCPRIELRSGRHEYNFRFSRRSGRAVCQYLNDPRRV